MSQIPDRHRRFDDLKERALTAGTLLAFIVAIVALYAIMFVALSRWTNYAPVSLPNDVSGPAEAIPWAQ